MRYVTCRTSQYIENVSWRLYMRSHVIFVKNCSGVSFGTFEHNLHIDLVFLSLTLKMWTPAGQYFFYV